MTASCLPGALSALSFLAPLAAQGVPQVATKVLLEIPSDGPDHTFNRVSGVLGLPSGGAVILSSDTRSLLYFDASGRLLKTVGRTGSGPGEFRHPGFLGTKGDSVWVWDRTLSRITVLSAEGTLGRTIPVTVSGDGVLFADGSVGIFTIRGYSSTFMRPDSLTVMRVTSNGNDRPSTIFGMAAPYRILKYSISGRTIVGRQPFDAEALLAPALDGSGFVAVESQGVDEQQHNLRVRRYDPLGRLLFDRHFKRDGIPIRRGDIDQAVLQLRQTPGNAQYDAEIRSNIYVPRFLPPVRYVLLGRDGTVWLRVASAPDARLQRWLTLSSKGALDKEVVMDAAFWPMDIRGNMAWGLMIRPGEPVSVRLIQVEAVPSKH